MFSHLLPLSLIVLGRVKRTRSEYATGIFLSALSNKQYRPLLLSILALARDDKPKAYSDKE